MASQGNFLPISEISAYQSKWTVKARVTNKAPMRTFKRGAGEGKVFHADLLDAAGGEIRASFFNDAADKFFNMLEVKRCFTFSKGSARIANKQYNTTNHRYELIFESSAMIEAVSDDVDIGEASSFKFEDIRAVAEKPLPSRADLCGIVSAFRPCSTVTAKDGRELIKRDVTLVDDTATSMEVTLWADLAKTEDQKFEGQPVIGIKSVLVKEFNGGRSGSTIINSVLVFEPKGEVADRVRRWWLNEGSSQTVASVSSTGSGGGLRRNSQQCNLAFMRQASSNIVSDQVEFYSCVSRVALLQTRKQGEQIPLYYTACGEQQEGKALTCNRRVDANGYCSSCGRTSGKTNLRLNIRCRFADFSDSVWLTTFHEGAEKVLALKAEDVQLIESSDGGRDKLDEKIKMRYFVEPIQVTVRAKLDSFNGEPRVNMSCIDARPVNHKEHGRVLLKEILQLLDA